MPSDAHAQRFDAVRRDADARKARKKKQRKDIQFNKKERKILAALDKLMAAEQQYVDHYKCVEPCQSLVVSALTSVAAR